MTAPVSKKKHLFIIISIIVILVGIAAFVLAYGIKDGWDVVASWFTSKYAILLYIGLGCYALFVAWFLISEKVKKL